ncbi:MAG: ExeA family protein [Candidatus Binatia bacterium]
MYKSYFGFDEKPFNVTPDPRFFYTNPGYQEAYANLLYGVRERKGFLLLTGEVGTGKTTILQRLMEELESTVRFVFFYNTNLSFEELLTFICQELGLPVKEGGRLEKIGALNEFLLNQLRNGSTTVLFIDEAQNLKAEVFENLRLLSNLETPREKLLQIVLTGQPELEAKLDRTDLRQLKQRIFSQSRLSSLSEEEVGAFIDYRLKAVGCRRNDLFPRDAVREIALYSKGIPRLINIMCDNALLIAYAASETKVTADIIKEVARDMRLDTGVKVGSRAQAANLQIPSIKINELNGNHPATVRRESPDPARPLTAAPETQDATVSLAKEAPAQAKSETEDISQAFLDLLTSALIEAMGPMAPRVIRDQLTTLGTSSATLPKGSIERLVESVSAEILDDVLRAGFQKKISTLVGTLNGNGRNANA